MSCSAVRQIIRRIAAQSRFAMPFEIFSSRASSSARRLQADVPCRAGDAALGQVVQQRGELRVTVAQRAVDGAGSNQQRLGAGRRRRRRRSRAASPRQRAACFPRRPCIRDSADRRACRSTIQPNDRRLPSSSPRPTARPRCRPRPKPSLAVSAALTASANGPRASISMSMRTHSPTPGGFILSCNVKGEVPLREASPIEEPNHDPGDSQSQTQTQLGVSIGRTQRRLVQIARHVERWHGIEQAQEPVEERQVHHPRLLERHPYAACHPVDKVPCGNPDFPANRRPAATFTMNPHYSATCARSRSSTAPVTNMPRR